MPRTKKIHALKRPKVRQDWSKWNLYNLSRVFTPPAFNKTFFQQKWLAKSMLRAYHNPDVREGTWTRMFDRRLPAVVPMDHRYLAKHDGSEMASGRGLGAETDPDAMTRRDGGMRRQEKTSYMHMTFYPLERRLDTAIFRALFASSVRQARQMVVHGFVKVNGKKMVYPGYQLNPGDLFSVDPEMVLFSTGAQKMERDSPKSLQDHRREQQAVEEGLEEEEEKNENRAIKDVDDDFIEYEGAESTVATASLPEPAKEPKPQAEGEEGEAESPDTPDPQSTAKISLRALLRRAKFILSDSKDSLSGKRQQELRGFTQDVKKTFSSLRGTDAASLETSIDAFETALAEILTKIPTDAKPPTATETPSENATSNPQMQDSSKTDAYRARKDAELLHAALERARANPVDVSKPYATPWQPREFMSAFAFIPRYLEVNQLICSAVYLRHPVARPGLAEVPTPFSAETMGLGFNWYLRRR